MGSRPLSDHFDGNRFFNPTLPQDAAPRFSKVWKMLRTPRVPWPESVKNIATPSLSQNLRPEEIAITFVNHATFLIQTNGVNILTDPVWSERASPFQWMGPRRVRQPGMELNALPKIDIILLSHNHYDHLDVATLSSLAKRFSPLTLVAAGDKKLVESTGLENVHELDWWEKWPAGPELDFTFAPTQHFSARHFFDRQKSLWGSFMIRSRERLIYFGGDSGYSTHYQEIKKRLGAPDLALLGMGAYEPRWFMRVMHMNPAEAVQAHLDLSAKQSIGMHFGTFRLTTEPFNAPKADLKIALAQRGLPEQNLITLDEGQTRIF